MIDGIGGDSRRQQDKILIKNVFFDGIFVFWIETS
jgi:hypothetical protein